MVFYVYFLTYHFVTYCRDLEGLPSPLFLQKGPLKDSGE